MNNKRTLYDILQVSENASDEVIKAAYLSLIKKYHPDSNLAFRKEATEMTVLLNDAYSVLSNPQKRKEYDASLHSTAAYQASTSKTPPRQSYSNLKPGDRSWTCMAKIFVGCMLALLIYLIFMVFHSSNEPSAPIVESTVQTTVVAENDSSVASEETVPKQYREYAAPSHGSVLLGSLDVSYGDDYLVDFEWSGVIYAPLRIEPPTDNKYYCVKFQSITSDRKYMFFIRGGQRALDYNIICDTYVVSFATGYTWYGNEYLFGEETQCYRFDDLFEFTYDEESVYGNELTLYEVADGNLTKEPISIDEF